MLSKMYYTEEERILSQTYQIFVASRSPAEANALRDKRKSYEALDYINRIRNFMVTEGLSLQKANQALVKWGVC